MTLNDFVTALTKRCSAGMPARSLKDQCNASPTVRELLSTGPGTGMAAVIEPDGRLRMRFQPIYKKDVNGELIHVIANGSDTELVPLLLGPEYASHFTTVCKHNRFPCYGVSARTPIPPDVFKGTGYIDTANIYVGVLSPGSSTLDISTMSSKASSGTRRLVTLSRPSTARTRASG